MRAQASLVAKTFRCSTRALHTSPAGKLASLSAAPRIYKFFAENIEVPHEIIISSQAYRDCFGCPMQSFLAGWYNLSDKISGYVKAMVLRDPDLAVYNKPFSLLSTRRVLHPNILSSVGGYVGKSAILEPVDCSLEGLIGTPLGHASLGCFHTVDGVKDRWPTLPSGIMQSLVRQFLELLEVCHSQGIHINNFNGNSFLLCKSLINSSGSAYTPSAHLKLLLRDPIPSRDTDVEMLHQYLKQNVFKPLHLPDHDLSHVFSLSKTEFLTKLDISMMLNSPFFYTPTERASLVSEAKDFVDDHYGRHNVIYAMERAFPQFPEWYSKVDKGIKNRLRYGYSNNPRCPYGYMSCFRACSIHRAEYASYLRAVKKPNPLGDTYGNSGMYFDKILPKFVSELYQVMQNINSNIRP